MPSTLLTFSQSLLQLVRLARGCSLEQFMPAALAIVQKEIGFRSVWWGWVSEPDANGIPPRIYLNNNLGLTEAFAQEWCTVSSGDEFARTSRKNPGSVLRFSADAALAPVLPIEHFAKRHDLFHSMAMTTSESTSGMMFFIVAYRGIADAQFSEAEAALFGEFVQHLLQLMQQNLCEALTHGTNTNAANLGLISSLGKAIFLGHALCLQIKQQWPDWDGITLPSKLVQQLSDAPCVMPLGKEAVDIKTHGDNFLIRLTSDQSSPLLAPRQHRVAVLYVMGHSYKEIAQTLSLSPATVRTYLRDCYAKLGVCNRIALSGALVHATTRARVPTVGKNTERPDTCPFPQR